MALKVKMKAGSFLLTSIPILIQFYANKYLQDDLAKTSIELESELNVPKIKKFDFIVVGGGTAGCVIAGRLSQTFNVLLLEAGGNPPPATNVPYFVSAVTKDPNINYFFRSILKSNPSKMKGGGSIHTGKMLGGSASHNSMIHSRGSPRDYDNWAKITKDESFKYINVLKYFTKYEDFIGVKFGNDSNEYYGKGGPITVDTNIVPILPLWFAAGKELGYEIGDPNGFQREGFQSNNIASHKGQRSSSYLEYVKPFENKRVNLTVIRYANVSEILLDENRKAYGVAYTRHNIFPQIAHATKEIILSAGAFSSPLLLMKSGIGPVETLKAAEIPVKVPLEAVGKQLSEHPAVILSHFSVNDSSLFLSIDPNQTEKLVEDYHKGKGGLAMISEGSRCFIVSSKAEKSWPNLWIGMNSIVTTDGEQQVIFYTVLGRPKSRGELNLDTVKYKSGVRDDVQLALIDFKMLTNPDDMNAMLEGVKFVLKIAEGTKAFQSLNMKYNEGPDTACVQFTYRSDKYWRCHIEQQVTSWTHMVSTCSMGPDSDDSNSSVVDTKFRVRGVTGLRVVDASVIPAVPNTNINAAILMLGEKASDDILHTW